MSRILPAGSRDAALRQIARRLAGLPVACDTQRMEWREEGMVLLVRPHGEHAAIAEVFTPTHGRHAGVVRGGAGRRMAPVLQPGAQVDVTWHARLGEHIGAFAVEPVRSRSALLADRLGLAGLNAICALLHVALPEREANPALYAATQVVLDAVEGQLDWPALYLRWEVGLLEQLGFGLDLGSCAVTGTQVGLAFVSPRSGRAVSRDAAGDWADKLFPLPACMGGDMAPGAADVAQGLAITGHFLARELAPVLGERPLPDARRRLVGMLGS
jgi:DNA repair protein RecO (recombination protein O)